MTLPGIIAAVGLAAAAGTAAPWPGVDELVTERIAKDAGRTPARPVLDTSRGDLALFAFLWAGILGGAVFGYCLRMIASESPGARPTGGRDDPP